jgi:hypothetical protein
MTIEQIRLAGGVLDGQSVWVEQACQTLNVHMGGQIPGATRTLHYRRTGTTLCFMGESNTEAPPVPGMQPQAPPSAAAAQ